MPDNICGSDEISLPSARKKHALTYEQAPNLKSGLPSTRILIPQISRLKTWISSCLEHTVSRNQFCSAEVGFHFSFSPGHAMAGFVSHSQSTQPGSAQQPSRQ